MPTYDLDATRTALKTLLETITEIAFVYDRRNPNLEGYPAIVFDIVSNENEMLTNVENLRTIMFSIWIIQEINVIGMDQANEILDIATQKVVNVLEDIDNISLSGNVDWMRPISGPREEAQSPKGSVMWQRIDLDMRVASSVL